MQKDISRLLSQEYDKVLSKAKMIELNMIEFKISTELLERERTITGLKKYITEKLKDGDIKRCLLAREALILSNPYSLLIKEIDQIILQNITEELFIDLFDYIAENYEDGKIDFCYSFVKLMQYIEKNDDLIQLDEVDKKLIDLVLTSFQKLKFQEELVDSEDVRIF
jgi:hypothetical protein